MKVRRGFVSNSSTTSFCVYGTPVTDGEADIFYSHPDRKSFGLSKKYMQDGLMILGRSWDQIKDDQAGKQFKEEIEEALQTIFGRPMDCDTWEDGYYDG